MRASPLDPREVSDERHRWRTPSRWLSRLPLAEREGYFFFFRTSPPTSKVGALAPSLHPTAEGLSMNTLRCLCVALVGVVAFLIQPQSPAQSLDPVEVEGQPLGANI